MNSFITLWSFLAVALEGIPISSSSHAMLITALVASWSGSSLFALPKGLDHFLHLFTLIAVTIYFYPRWLPYLSWRRNWWLIQKVIVLGFIVEALTALLYFIREASSFSIPYSVGFFITGIALLSLYYCPSRRHGAGWDYRLSILLGIAQGCALLPGISRLGITYCVARWYGMSPRRSFELSFLIEWPISCAGFLKGAYFLAHHAMLSELLNLPFVLSMVIATLMLYFGLWGMERLSMQRKLFYVGWYMSGVALLCWLYSW